MEGDHRLLRCERARWSSLSHCVAIVFPVHVDADQALASSHVRSAVEALVALDEHLTCLLGYTDLLAALGNEIASSDMRCCLMRAITALRALREEVLCLQIVERMIAGNEKRSCYGR